MVVPEGFMRLAPYSSMEMVRVGSDSAQMRLHKGWAIVDLREVWDKDSVSVVIGENEIKFLKGGLYRLEARENEPVRLKVFKGKAAVITDGEEKPVKSKRMMEIGGASDAAVKFDPKDIDSFDEWQRLRAGVIGEKRKAAMAAARKGEGERADLLLLKQGSAMWGCRQTGIGCGAFGGGLGGSQGGIAGPRPGRRRRFEGARRRCARGRRRRRSALGRPKTLAASLGVPSFAARASKGVCFE